MPLSALNDTSGTPVDWWFAYKLPNLKNPANTPGAALGQAAGTEYLYCDATEPALPRGLSRNTAILKSGALVNTLQQIRAAAAKKDPNVGWFFYNDEHCKIGKKPIPGQPLDNAAFGHTKGVLAFDLKTDTAFWLLHSWPCFPSIAPVDDPAVNFGQTFLCVTLKDVATADGIAGIFCSQQQSQIIGLSVPAGLDATKFPGLAQFAQTAPPAPVPRGSTTPFEQTFQSKAGATFQLFAKSKDWIVPASAKQQAPKDLYSDFIGPKLQIDLDTETWQDGEPDEDSDHVHTTEDIQWVDLSALGLDAAWNFLMHDHAKWAVSRDPDTQDETDWVIVGDINRIDTQFKRGGGAIAFQNRDLARSLHSIIMMVPPAADAAAMVKARAKRHSKNGATKSAAPGGGATAPVTAKPKPKATGKAANQAAAKAKSPRR